jgi:RNA polymerase primary sigma factor
MGHDACDNSRYLVDEFLEKYERPLSYEDLSKYLSGCNVDFFDLQFFFCSLDHRDLLPLEESEDRALRDVLGNSDGSANQNSKSAANQYFHSISDHDLLSADDEVRLFRALEKGEEWLRQAVLSTIYAVEQFGAEVDVIVRENRSVKNVIDVSRTEKISEEREQRYLETVRSVSEDAPVLADKLRKYDEAESWGIETTLRQELIAEFSRLEVDRSLIDEWSTKLRENPQWAGLSESSNQLLGEALSFLEFYRNHFRNRIVASNLKLVVSQVSNYLNRGLSYMDLVQEGNLGLLEAIKGFDYQKGYKFSTYATWWIRQAMQRAVHQKTGIINIPVHRREEMAKVLDARETLRQELKRKPDWNEIAEKLNWSEEKVERILSVQDRTISLETSREEDDRDLLEEIENTGSTEVKAPLMVQQLRDEINELLSDYDWRKQQIIRMRFGLDDRNQRTLREIGELVDLSKERVRQIEKEILANLRERARERDLQAFLDSREPNQNGSSEDE